MQTVLQDLEDKVFLKGASVDTSSVIQGLTLSEAIRGELDNAADALKVISYDSHYVVETSEEKLSAKALTRCTKTIATPKLIFGISKGLTEAAFRRPRPKPSESATRIYDRGSAAFRRARADSHSSALYRATGTDTDQAPKLTFRGHRGNIIHILSSPSTSSLTHHQQRQSPTQAANRVYDRGAQAAHHRGNARLVPKAFVAALIKHTPAFPKELRQSLMKLTWPASSLIHCGIHWAATCTQVLPCHLLASPKVKLLIHCHQLPCRPLKCTFPHLIPPNMELQPAVIPSDQPPQLQLQSVTIHALFTHPLAYLCVNTLHPLAATKDASFPCQTSILSSAKHPQRPAKTSPFDVHKISPIACKTSPLSLASFLLSFVAYIRQSPQPL